MDLFVERFSETLALAPGLVDVYWVEDASGGEVALCSEGVLGCYSDDKERIIASEVPAAHELVHALFGINGLDPGSFVNEGVAHVFEENHGWNVLPLEGSIESGLEHDDARNGGIPLELRGRAGHFLRFIYSDYGVGALRSLVRRRITGLSPEAQSQVFFEVTGEHLDTVLERYAAAKECSLPEFRDALVACSQEPKPWDTEEDQWSALLTLGCGRADTMGPFRGTMWTTRTFDVDQPGEFELLAPGSPNDPSLIQIGRCGSTCEEPFLRTMRPGTPEKVDLGPGRYYSTFYRMSDDPGGVGLSVRRLSFSGSGV